MPHRYILASLLAAIFALGCRQPTEVEVEIFTDLKCDAINNTIITVGKPADIDANSPITSTDKCDQTTETQARIGSLVIAPSGENDEEFGVRITLGITKSAEECSAMSDDGCIVARRLLYFIPHEKLFLPINLRSNCDGQWCDVTTTCVVTSATLTKCVPAKISDPSLCVTKGLCDESLLDCGDKSTDLDNCGSCGHDCLGDSSVATRRCVGGQCAPICNPGFLDCNTPGPGNQDDGCESSNTDPNSCGSCTATCPSNSNCVNDGNYFRCGCTAGNGCGQGTCINDVCVCTSGTQCTYGESCLLANRCECSASSTFCNSATQPDGQPLQVCCPDVGCVDIRKDSYHCGSCGNACPNNGLCTNGVCAN